jgi:cytochrome c oxidase cbb3-type subunit III
MFMNCIQSIQKKILATALSLLVVVSSMAQDAAPAVAEKPSSNLLATLLMVVAVVLAFIIWGMGQALIAISRMALEKAKQSKVAATLLLIIGAMLLSHTGMAQEATATTAENAKAAVLNYGGLSPNNFWAFVGVIVIEVAAIIFLAFSIRRVYQELVPAKAAASTTRLSSWWSGLDKKFFTKAVAVEKEADILLDHDYDGIKELDNSLPPWWKYGFYITIVVGVIYLFYFHMGAGQNPTEEYLAEMNKARIEKEIFEANNKDKVDENNVPMADANGIKAGQALYEANCVACHLKDGGGNVGPNLTDDYWLHKGSLNDIYKSIKIGYPDKGMQAWNTKFNPKEISQIASYIKSLKGTKPAEAKAAQGDLYVEAGTAAVADSTATLSADSTTLTGKTAGK